MNSFTINREAVPPALPRTGSWHVLLAVGVVLTGCGARGLQSTGGDAAQAGGAGAGGALSSGGISGAGGALSRAGASAGVPCREEAPALVVPCREEAPALVVPCRAEPRDSGEPVTSSRRQEGALVA